MRDMAAVILSDVPAGCTVIDIGGLGPGDMPHLLAVRKAFDSRNATRLVVDCQDGADLVCNLDTKAGLEALREYVQPGHCVWISHTLDHLEDPIGVLRACASASRLIVVQGNPYSPVFRYMEEMQRRRGKRYSDDDTGHLYNWSRKSMTTLLARAGWVAMRSCWVGCSHHSWSGLIVNELCSFAPSQFAVAYAVVCGAEANKEVLP